MPPSFALLLLQSPAPAAASNKSSWSEVFGKLITSPMAFVWIIAILLLLFAMSRLNNNLEIRSVNRAITLSRSLVGFFMWFLVAPIVAFIFVNIFALINRIEMIDASFLGKWIGLTFSSYWWLVQCFFGAEKISGQKDAYTLDAVIRILWVSVPLLFIWLRTASTLMWKLAIIPLILGFFIIARHKKANETFITKEYGREFFEKLPIIGGLLKAPAPVPGGKVNKPKTAGENTKNIVIFAVLGVFILGGVVVALYYTYYVAGLICVVIGIFGMFLLAPSADMKVLRLQHADDHPINANIDSLIRQMDSVYIAEGASTRVYELSQQIDAALHAQQDMVKFPDTVLCKPQYRAYFYDWCE